MSVLEVKAVEEHYIQEISKITADIEELQRLQDKLQSTISKTEYQYKLMQEFIRRHKGILDGERQIKESISMLSTLKYDGPDDDEKIARFLQDNEANTAVLEERISSFENERARIVTVFESHFGTENIKHLSEPNTEIKDEELDRIEGVFEEQQQQLTKLLEQRKQLEFDHELTQAKNHKVETSLFDSALDLLRTPTISSFEPEVLRLYLDKFGEKERLSYSGIFDKDFKRGK